MRINEFYCGIITYHKEYVPDYLKQKNRDEGRDVPESVIEAFVTKIVVSQDGFDWYLRFDGDPDDPLHCKIEGKRKNTTKIVVAGANSPAIHRSATGRDQGI